MSSYTREENNVPCLHRLLLSKAPQFGWGPQEPIPHLWQNLHKLILCRSYYFYSPSTSDSLAMQSEFCLLSLSFIWVIVRFYIWVYKLLCNLPVLWQTTYRGNLTCFILLLLSSIFFTSEQGNIQRSPWKESKCVLVKIFFPWVWQNTWHNSLQKEGLILSQVLGQAQLDALFWF